MAELTDCVQFADLPAALRDDPHASGPWCWVLADPRPLARPVACQGKLRLWEAPLDVPKNDEQAGVASDRLPS